MVEELSPTTSRPWIADAHPPSPLSRWLDRFVAAQRTPFGSDVPAYLAFGVAGIAAGAATLTALLAAAQAALALVVIVAVIALAVFVLTGLARQRLLGAEQHALLEDVLLALAAVAGASALLGADVPAVLDATVLAFGVFLVFGRLGCLAFGCCHGLPSGFGVRYHGGLHEDDPLTGVRLFPIQLVEAAWLAILTAAGVLVLASGAPAGTALSVWLVGYCVARFVMDFVRGDRHGRRLGPLTGAQLLSLLVILGVVAVDEARNGPEPERIAAAALALLVATAAYAARSRWITVDRGPVDEDVAGEWQAMLPQLEDAARGQVGGATLVAPTRRGDVRVTLVVDPLDAGRELHAFALAGEGWALRRDDAAAIASVALQRLPAHRVVRADPCEHDAFHLWVVVDPGSPPGSTVEDEPGAILLRARAAASETLAVPLPMARDAPLDPQLLPHA